MIIDAFALDGKKVVDNRAGSNINTGLATSLIQNCGISGKWSENMCWMYDCDFELIDKDDIENIVVCGPRGKDCRLRLLLVGIPDEKIVHGGRAGRSRQAEADRRKPYICHVWDGFHRFGIQSGRQGQKGHRGKRRGRNLKVKN